MRIDIIEAGAIADGKTKVTEVVQKAVDACGENGGGVVTFPAGQYLMGKVCLRSHVTIELQSGCRIIASPDEADYPMSPGYEDSLWVCPSEDELEKDRWLMNRRQSVFYGCSLEDIHFCGPGMIDGNCENILVPQDRKYEPSWACYEKDLDILAGKGFRPVLIYLEDCHQVKIEDIYLYHAPVYTMNFLYCTHMWIRGIRIDNLIGADNADGMHITSCSDVFISDCDLYCGDDSIAIDADDGKPAERFLITNCNIASRNNCFRIFHSLHDAHQYTILPRGVVRDITISNITVKEADSVVCINCDWGEISQVVVQGVTGTMSRNGAAFLITSHNDSKVERVLFDNWFITARGGGYMYAEPGSVISDVELTRINMEIRPKTQTFCCGLRALPKVSEECSNKNIPQYWWSHSLPFFMQIVNTENVSLEKVSIRWGEETLDELDQMASPEGKKFLEELETEYGYPKFYEPTRDWPAVRVDDSVGFTAEKLNLEAHGNQKDALVIYEKEQLVKSE